MTKRIYALLVLLSCATFTFAQNSLDVPSYDGSSEGFQDEERTEVSDEKYFPPKPKHGTEIGLNIGHHFIHGDVYARPGWGIGLHVRRAINYTMSWRIQGVYGQNFGLEDRLSRIGYVTSDDDEGSGIQLPKATYEGLGYQHGSQIYRNYRTTTGWVSGHFIANISNILFHKKENKWNLYVFAGPSLLYYKGKTNLLNENGTNYTRLNGVTPGMEVNIAGIENNEEWLNRDRLKEIKKYLDSSYETPFVYGNGNPDDAESNVPGYQDFNLLGRTNFSLMPSVDVGAGVARKFGKRINIALEHQAMISLNDDLDGHVAGRNVDVPHYTNLKINFNLMRKDAIEPLYWVNPLDNSMRDIAEIKKNRFKLKDADGDGVVDEFDEEPDTPEDCPVDTKGRRLDSDGDGVFDCDDAEPYTPFDLIANVDDKGVAPEVEVCEDCLTKEDILRIGKENRWDVQPAPAPAAVARGCGEWFLPMIHFDLNKYNLKSEAKAQLHHIARVMKECPEICVVAHGHTDKLNNNAYNEKLSYNRAKTAVDYLTQVYGISPSRLKVNYGGEESPLVDTNASSFINRRVEFRVCKGEIDMGSPDGSSPNNGGFGTSGSAPVKY